MTSNIEKLTVRRNKGTADVFPEACHSLLTLCQSKFDSTAHNGLDIIAYLERGNPVAVLAKTAMSDSDFASLKPEDTKAADRLAYAILTLMFDHGSVASRIILTQSKNGTISIGEGLKLYAALHVEFARANTTNLDVSSKTKQLSSFTMASKESASSYILRFQDIVSTLGLKSPPQKFPEILLMQWLCSGLHKDYKEVVRMHDRNEYKDMSELLAAIRHEAAILELRASKIQDDDDAVAAVTSDVPKLTKKERKALKKQQKQQAAEQQHDSNDSSSALSMQGNDGGKGNGNPHANKQCYLCHQWGHVASHCTAVDLAKAAWGRTGMTGHLPTPPSSSHKGSKGKGRVPRPKMWCPYHQMMVSHTVAECFLNPFGKGKGKGYGRGSGPSYTSSFPSSYYYKGAKGAPRGYGRGLAAQGDVPLDTADYDFSDMGAFDASY